MDPAQVVPFIPEGMVLEILTRLPVKSLFRARAVCKSWYHLTFGEFFLKLHRKNCPLDSMAVVETNEPPGWKPKFICVDNLRGAFRFSIDFLPDMVRVGASCSGLLFCSSLRRVGTYYICNPLTRDFKTLPLLMWNKLSTQGIIAALPEGSEVGFVCDLSAQTYRVVLLTYFLRESPHGLERVLGWFAFDSESNEWKLHVSLEVNLFRLVGNVSAVFVNGAFHWLEDGSRILVIDSRDNLARIMYLPIFLEKTDWNELYLFELDGHLSIVETTIDRMCVWEFTRKEGVRWTLVDGVSLEPINASVRPRAISLTVDNVFLLHRELLLMYNRKSHQWRMMRSGRDGSFSMLSLAFAFCGTLCRCR